MSWGGLDGRSTSVEIDWAHLPEATPRNAFSKQTVETTDDVVALIKDVPQVARIVNDALPDDQVERALTGQGWMSVQLKSDLELPGNYQLVEDEAVERPSVARAGEVLQVYVPTDTCNTHKTVVICAWCGNPVVWARKGS